MNSILILILIITASTTFHIFFVRYLKYDQYRILKTITIFFLILMLKHYIVAGGLQLLLINSLIYILFQYNYFQLINLRETGRRARIIQEIYNSAINLSKFSEIYSIKELVDKRVDRLIEAGRVHEKNRELSANNDGILVVNNILIFLKKLFYGVEKLD